MKNQWNLKKFFLIMFFCILMIAGCGKENKEEENTITKKTEDTRQQTSADKVDQSNLDVVFVMDKSGSMLKSDKGRVAVTGAKMFLDMMRNTGSHVAVVDFASKANASDLITVVDSEKNKDYLKEYLDDIKYGSGVTDYGLALKKAVSVLGNAEGNNQKTILFFTDGNLNTGKKRKLSEAKTDIENAIDEAQKKGYKV